MSVHASFTQLDSGPWLDAPAEAGQRAPVVQAQDAQLDEGLGQPVGDLDVVEPARSRGEAQELVEVGLVHDLLLEREVRAPLVGERGVGDRPALVRARR